VVGWITAVASGALGASAALVGSTWGAAVGWAGCAGVAAGPQAASRRLPHIRIANNRETFFFILILRLNLS
jgi:hypothetical protein